MGNKIEVLEARPVRTNATWYKFAGLSTEAKPTEGVATGSLFHEVDTATVYAFDAYTQTWYVQCELGGEGA